MKGDMFSWMDSNEPDLDCSEILPQSLFLGGYEVANDASLLSKLGISHVVQLGNASEIADLYRVDSDKFVIHRILVEDSVRDHMTPALLDFALNFIAESLCSGGRVLVHCRAGVSRSSSVVIAFLVRERGMGVKEARIFVKQRRPCICPNSTFQKDLVDYAKVVQDKRSN